VPCKRRSPGDDLKQPKGFDRIRLPLEGEWLDGLDLDGIAHEQTRLGTDERLPRGGRLLEAGGDVDGVAGDERLALSADDDLARVDADAGLEPVLGDRGAHLRGGADCAQGVVLVRDRYPEDRHGRIPDELLHDPAVPLDDRAEVLEVAAHAGAQRLRVSRLPERGRADKVAENDGEDLALLARDLRARERRPAGVCRSSPPRDSRARSSGREPWAESRPSSLRDNPRPVAGRQRRAVAEAKLLMNRKRTFADSNLHRGSRCPLIPITPGLDSTALRQSALLSTETRCRGPLVAQTSGRRAGSTLRIRVDSRGKKPCNCGRSEEFAAKCRSVRLGLSPRRSRVRVPSLPSSPCPCKTTLHADPRPISAGSRAPQVP
jgi:hypothetical protein